jgi:hypothetical protein
VDKNSGDVAINNYQFWTAYNDVCSGYISSYNNDTGLFDGV